MSNFLAPGCCFGCNCGPVTLNFASDGAGGLANWYPTVELTETESDNLPTIASEMTLVSREDVFCSDADSPFIVNLISFTTQASFLGGTIRLMARLSATVEDGIAIVGDHVFMIATAILDNEGHGKRQWWIRVGVSIDGDDTILQSGIVNTFTAPSANVLLRFFSAIASSTGQIKHAFASEVHLQYLLDTSAYGLNAGDYFVCIDDVPLTGSDGILNCLAGETWRLDDLANRTKVASWTKITDTDAEFDDAMLNGGHLQVYPGTSIYLADSDEDFTAFAGRRIGLQIIDLPVDVEFDYLSLVCSNGITPDAILCEYEIPVLQVAPIQRETRYPDFSVSISGEATSLFFAHGFRTPTVTIFPDLPHLGSSPITESIIGDGASLGARRYDYYRDGPFTHFSGDDFYLYLRVSVGWGVTFDQTKERQAIKRLSGGSVNLNNYGRSETSWSLEQLIAGSQDFPWSGNIDLYETGLHLIAEDIHEGNFYPADSWVYTPSCTNGTTNEGRLSTYELTITVPEHRPA